MFKNWCFLVLKADFTAVYISQVYEVEHVTYRAWGGELWSPSRLDADWLSNHKEEEVTLVICDEAWSHWAEHSLWEEERATTETETSVRKTQMYLFKALWIISCNTCRWRHTVFWRIITPSRLHQCFSYVDLLHTNRFTRTQSFICLNLYFSMMVSLDDIFSESHGRKHSIP